MISLSNIMLMHTKLKSEINPASFFAFLRYPNHMPTFRFDFRMFRIVSEIVRNSRVQNFDIPKILSFAFVLIPVPKLQWSFRIIRMFRLFIRILQVYILLQWNKLIRRKEYYEKIICFIIVIISWRCYRM